MMKEKILIVEDEFIVANNLQLILIKAGYEICGIATSVDEAKSFVENDKPTWVLLDIFLQDGSQGTDLADYLAEKGIAYIYISANTNQSILERAKATQPYGFLVKPFRERDLLIMLDIAREKHQNNIQFKQQQEFVLQKQLELVTHTSLDLNERWKRIPGIFQPLIPFDLMRITILNKRSKNTEEITFVRTGFDEYQVWKKAELASQLGLPNRTENYTKTENANTNGSKLYIGSGYKYLLDEKPFEKALNNRYRLECKLFFPLELNYGDLASLSFYNRKADCYSVLQLNLLTKATAQVVELLKSLNQGEADASNEKTNDELNDKSNRDYAKNTNTKFSGIIGNSPALLSVLDKVAIVAPAQSSVLILGESGTGKERIAQCIHELSPRKSKPIITVNCAALPKDLIESELFGHEKGAFTGALEKRLGKFQLADGGTIFLDEIGELPLDAQVKILRVLQEKEIEHIGGGRSIKINVRIIAATNRKLEKEVADGRFRLDLYYRLNVFPIELPPLRERRTDIPLLADYFIEKYCHQMEKKKLSLSQTALRQLESYQWPGNIRELEHLLERSILLSTGLVINQISLPTAVTETLPVTSLDYRMKTLEEIEADHIVSVLKACKGKIGGNGGAAEILGLPPSTLNSKIKKLGIQRDFHFNQ